MRSQEPPCCVSVHVWLRGTQQFVQFWLLWNVELHNISTALQAHFLVPQPVLQFHRLNPWWPAIPCLAASLNVISLSLIFFMASSSSRNFSLHGEIYALVYLCFNTPYSVISVTNFYKYYYKTHIRSKYNSL
jgi:hypothetical protein